MIAEHYSQDGLHHASSYPSKQSGQEKEGSVKTKSNSSVLFSGALLCLILATGLCCTGCGSITTGSNKEVKTGDSSDDVLVDDLADDTLAKDVSEGAQSEELPRVIHFPDEYLITYEVESEYGVLTQISGGKDAQGRIYFKRQLDETLFIPTSGGYYQYYIDTDGTPVELDNTVYTQEFVDEIEKSFFEYSHQYTLDTSDVVSYVGKTQVAGRDCRAFEMTLTSANITQRYSFATDEETGICMTWKLTSEVSDYTLPTDIGFTCTEFVTSEVKLPISDQ